MKQRLAMTLVSAALLACQKPGDADPGKRVPRPPPVPDAGVAEISIDVDVDVGGVTTAGPKIDAARLAASPPEWRDDEHRAWRLATLLGTPASDVGAKITVMGTQGVEVTIASTGRSTDPVPALVVTRRGDVVVELIAPDDPFPAYHGRGGRLHRPGDPLVHITGIRKIHVTPAAAIDEAAAATSGPTVDVIVAGTTRATWGPEELGRVPPFGRSDLGGDAGGDKRASGGGDGAKGAHATWSLRDLVHALVGANARVVAVSGSEGRKAIDAAAWADPNRIPVLRANREERFKFRWADRDGGLGEAEVREVRTLEIVP